MKSSSASPATRLVRALPKTGRTHQIRMHLTHVGHPVLCDRLYGGRAVITELELIPRDKIGQDTAEEQAACNEPLLDRQALHAHRLAIAHPTTRERRNSTHRWPLTWNGR